MLSAGWWDDATGHPVWMVKSSTDLGRSWAISDFYPGPYQNYFGFPFQIFFNKTGDAYVAGNIADFGDPTFMRSTCILRRLDRITGVWSDVVAESDSRSCVFVGGLSAGDALYLTQAQFDLVQGKPIRKASVRRSTDEGKTWEQLLENDAGAYQQGAQYNGIQMNALGEILLTGTQIHRPEGDEWVVRKWKP
jgi:hypothetical protein